MARPAGLEPTTLCLEGRCSIQLSYGRTRRRVTPGRGNNYARRLNEGKPSVGQLGDRGHPLVEFRSSGCFPSLCPGTSLGGRQTRSASASPSFQLWSLRSVGSLVAADAAVV